MVKRRKILKNSLLFRRAKHCLVGGVDSPVRSFNYVGLDPILIEKGKGAYVYDYDGNKYIDYSISWGALVLGHTHPLVVRKVKQALESGFSFGMTNKREIELAGLIKATCPFIEKIRFVNSGTEAVMGAVRLARGYTRREKIVKFKHSYHGSADYLLADSGSGLTTLNIPLSAGVPENFLKDTFVLPFGDREAVERLFKKYGKQIAAILVEPVGGNFGVLEPDLEFLRLLRQVTKKYGALLIFDEVITGFRFGVGTAAQDFKIPPDLICLGKIIGGGLPIGAFGGNSKIMNKLAPLGKVYQASTFAGNPIVMQAGISVLEILKKSAINYKRIEDLAAYLSFNLRKEAILRNIDLKVSNYGSMFSIKFKHKPQFRKFYLSMLESGVYFVPSEFESNFLSFAHTKKDIEKTIALTKEALDRLTPRRENVTRKY